MNNSFIHLLDWATLTLGLTLQLKSLMVKDRTHQKSVHIYCQGKTKLQMFLLMLCCYEDRDTPCKPCFRDDVGQQQHACIVDVGRDKRVLQIGNQQNPIKWKNNIRFLCAHESMRWKTFQNASWVKFKNRKIVSHKYKIQ